MGEKKERKRMRRTRNERGCEGGGMEEDGNERGLKGRGKKEGGNVKE